MIGRVLFGSISVFLIVFYYFAQTDFVFANAQISFDGLEITGLIKLQASSFFGITIMLFLLWSVFYWTFQKQYTLSNGLQIVHFLSNLFITIYLASVVFYFQVVAGFSRRYYSFSYDEKELVMICNDTNTKITITMVILVALQILFVVIIWFQKQKKSRNT